MYLGDTLEEKKESYELLTKRAKKLGTFFGVLMGIAGLVLGIALMSSAEGNKVMIVLLSCIIIVLMPVMYYWAGYLWYFGFVTVKSWFAKLGIGVAGATAAVGHSMAISYLLGGRKSVKITGIIWLIALMITLIIGFWVGLYDFFKIRAEVKKLGIA